MLAFHFGSATIGARLLRLDLARNNANSDLFFDPGSATFR
jgi:hypothetical protein